MQELRQKAENMLRINEVNEMSLSVLDLFADDDEIELEAPVGDIARSGFQKLLSVLPFVEHTNEQLVLAPKRKIYLRPPNWKDIACITSFIKSFD